MNPTVAIVTGASQGLGHAIAERLAAEGWSLVIDARHADRLDAAADVIRAAAPGRGAQVVAIAGDVTDPTHRRAVTDAARRLGPVDLLVNNASTIGASPLPRLEDLDPETLRRIYDTNVVAPAALVAELAGDLGDGATIVNVSSDAAVNAYEGWGGYGPSKAALDHLSRVLAAEHPEWRVLAIDPGDMRTEMHQSAFPGDDISDRPLAREIAPAVVSLIHGDDPSGRYDATAVPPC